jgi:hypothetical protein
MLYGKHYVMKDYLAGFISMEELATYMQSVDDILIAYQEDVAEKKSKLRETKKQKH